MGIYRSTPLLDKNTDKGKNESISYGACGMQGWRVSMEDSHIADIDNLSWNNSKSYLFGVFDGHGGMEVSEYVKRHFTQRLVQSNSFKEGKWKKTLEDNFFQMDIDMKTEKGKNELAQILKENDEEPQQTTQAGCTANVTLIVDGVMICANAGDSRTLLCSDGKPYPMSVDHKPDDEIEYNRITKAGGFVSEGRIDGNLNLSRCIGDFEYKRDENLSQKEQKIVATPDFKTKKLNNKDTFMILGCDGVWETMSNQEIITFVKNKMDKNVAIEKITEQLLDKLVAPDTSTGLGCDNMTCIVVDLRKIKKYSK